MNLSEVPDNAGEKGGKVTAEDLLKEHGPLIQEILAAKSTCFERVPDKDMDMQSGIPMHDTVHNAVHRVYFRAGMLAFRELLMRIINRVGNPDQIPIHRLWWPDILGPDPGAPRRLDWKELAVEKPDGGIASADIDVNVEALPYALVFVDAIDPPAKAEPPEQLTYVITAECVDTCATHKYQVISNHQIDYRILQIVGLMLDDGATPEIICSELPTAQAHVSVEPHHEIARVSDALRPDDE